MNISFTSAFGPPLTTPNIAAEFIPAEFLNGGLVHLDDQLGIPECYRYVSKYLMSSKDAHYMAGTVYVRSSTLVGF